MATLLWTQLQLVPNRFRVVAGASCIIAVHFTPASGVRTGALAITDNASGGTQGVTFRGTGTAP